MGLLPEKTRLLHARSLNTWFPAAALLGMTLIWFAIRGQHGIHFLSFADESGHLVGARAIHAGDRLYRDFIDAHGPLVFMFAHTFGRLFGWKEPLDARWAMVGLAALAGSSIATCASLAGLTVRLWAASLFFGLIAGPWLVQALNMVNYHLIGGAMVTIMLAWLVIPAWTGAPLGARKAFASGFCCAWLCADAYALAPSAVLLTASAGVSLRHAVPVANARSVILAVSAGFAAGAMVVLVWLLTFGDVVGYLVFHIIDNQVNYARYSTFGWSITLRSLVPSFAPAALVQSAAAVACLAGFALLMCSSGAAWLGRPYARLSALGLALAAVLMLNFRGAPGFQDGSFLVASIAVFSLAASLALSRLRTQQGVSAWLTTACLGILICGNEAACRAAVNSPWGVPRATYVAWRPAKLAIDLKTPIYRRIRTVLHPDERLLVLVYNPDFFLPAGFLPMRKYHDYLPWEADYARAPWFGRTRDLCADLASNPPPVIVYDGWVVWGRWDPKTFIPCLTPLLAKSYVADPINTLFIRRDRLPPA